MERRILVVPKTEPFGFTKVTEVNVNARVTGIQMYFPGEYVTDKDYRRQMDGSRKYRYHEGNREVAGGS